MQKGITLQELATRIEDKKNRKRDLIAAKSEFRMEVDDSDTPVIRTSGRDMLTIRDIAHSQFASNLDIPAKYYNRMRREDPALLASNVNRWLEDDGDTKRMLRTVTTDDPELLGHTGSLRSHHSNRYQRIDDEEIMSVAIPVLSEIPDARVISCELTEKRMYLQVVAPRIEADVKVGDTVQAGVMISNSEVGAGRVVVAPLAYRLVCLNGMVSLEKFQQSHIGRPQDSTEDLWADDTRAAEDKAVLLKVRDMVAAAVDQTRFNKHVEAMKEMAARMITGSPVKSIEVLSNKIGLNSAEQEGVLKSLITGADLSAWGVINAVTHQAHTVESYDRSVEFENLGGQLLEMNPSEWTKVLEAA